MLRKAVPEDRTFVRHVIERSLYRHLSLGSKFPFNVEREKHVRSAAIARLDLRLEFVFLHGIVESYLKLAADYTDYADSIRVIRGYYVFGPESKTRVNSSSCSALRSELNWSTRSRMSPVSKYSGQQ